jgi:hypothetical protein
VSSKAFRAALPILIALAALAAQLPYSETAAEIDGEGANLTHPSNSDERICLSLRVLAELAKIDPSREDVETLAGIGWIEGYVVDPEAGDVILIGRLSTGWPSLHLDDLAVNLRRIARGDVYPHCSLDPLPEDVLRLNALLADDRKVDGAEGMRRFHKEVRQIWGQQTVVVGGVPRNSRHAHVMLDADYHMKKLSQGIVAVEGVRSTLEIIADQSRDALERTGRIPDIGASMSRFWFHVADGHPAFVYGDGIVRLDSCSVEVMTERQRADVDGVLYDSGEDDPISQAFATQLSENYKLASTQVRDYADLENLFRLVAILGCIHLLNAEEEVGLDLGFLRNEYEYQREASMPASLPGQTNYDEIYLTDAIILLPMACGGVSMEMHIDSSSVSSGDHTVPIDQLRDAVVLARPDQESLYWTVSLD